jgi:hypothetical protein
MLCVGTALRRALLGTALVAAAACDDSNDPEVPFPGSLDILIAGGDGQHGAPAAWLAAPLLAEVVHATRRDPAPQVTVEWRVVSGMDAIVETAATRTDDDGTAQTRVRLGTAAGEYVIEASFPGMRGRPARFTLYASSGITVTSATPARLRAGDTVTVEGSGFAPRAADQLVMIDDVRAAIITADRTRLRVVVPSCMPTRTARLMVRAG